MDVCCEAMKPDFLNQSTVELSVLAAISSWSYIVFAFLICTQNWKNTVLKQVATCQEQKSNLKKRL